MEYILGLLILVVVFLFQLVAPALITIYLVLDSKKINEHVVLWGVLGGVSGLCSIPLGIMGLGINMLVLSIYFFKTKRLAPAIIWLVLFIMQCIITIIAYIFIMIGSSY